MPQDFGFPTFYSIYFPGKDNAVLFHGPLYQARKQFFEEQRASRLRGSAYIAGLETVYAGALGRKRLKWELRSGKIALEKAYPQKNGYSIVVRNLNGSILSKSTYSNSHIWLKTAYFSEGNPTRPIAVVSPAEESNGILLTEYDRTRRGYQKGPLYACPTEMGTRINSYLNAVVGEPCFYANYGGIDYCYYREELAAEKRKVLLAEILEGKVDAIPTWEPEPAAALPVSGWDVSEEASSVDIDKEYQYRGALNKAGERHGRGRTEQRNGMTAYEGEYRDGVRDGYGAYYYKDGQPCYIGQWKNGKKEGTGVSFRRETGGIHVGNWNAGMPQGPSAVFGGDGLLHSFGVSENGVHRTLEVRWFPEDHTILIGKLSGDPVSGFGTLFSADGRPLYSGHFRNGKREGAGVSFDSTGEPLFSGEWKDGKPFNGTVQER